VGPDEERSEGSQRSELADAALYATLTSLLVASLLAPLIAASLNSLVEQKNRMKGVKRVILDMATTLGVTNSTMRIIERRDVVDKYIVFAGIFVTCLVIWILYRWI
jgi:hypothetical protein